MKLFIWNKPISVSYGGTCLYVVAETEDQAREVAKKALISKYGHAPQERPGVDAPRFDRQLGPPTRVVETPCAEIYYWQE